MCTNTQYHTHNGHTHTHTHTHTHNTQLVVTMAYHKDTKELKSLINRGVAITLHALLGT